MIKKMSLQQNVSRNSSKTVVRTVPEDQSREWANTVIEKSIGGRESDSEPKLNWVMIICVAVIVAIAIIYFIYGPKSIDSNNGTSTGVPLLDQPVMATPMTDITTTVTSTAPTPVSTPVSALSAVTNPVNTSGTVQA